MKSFIGNHSELFVLIGIIISSVSLYKTYQPVEVTNIPQKELSCIINYSKPLITLHTTNENFKILYKDKEVSNPFLYNITIKNIGEKAIKNENFKNPLSIKFNDLEGILYTSILSSTNT